MLISVFDRWGEVIFITEDPEIGWNAGAMESGYFVPDGVYQWQLKVRAEHNVTIRLLQGHVTVLR
jgi:hypothetical protein